MRYCPKCGQLKPMKGMGSDNQKIPQTTNEPVQAPWYEPLLAHLKEDSPGSYRAAELILLGKLGLTRDQALTYAARAWGAMGNGVVVKDGEISSDV